MWEQLEVGKMRSLLAFYDEVRPLFLSPSNTTQGALVVRACVRVCVRVRVCACLCVSVISLVKWAKVSAKGLRIL